MSHEATESTHTALCLEALSLRGMVGFEEGLLFLLLLLLLLQKGRQLVRPLCVPLDYE